MSDQRNIGGKEQPTKKTVGTCLQFCIASSKNIQREGKGPSQNVPVYCLKTETKQESRAYNAINLDKFTRKCLIDTREGRAGM